MFPALATTLLFAITPVFANRAADKLGSTRANFWRLVAAVAALGLWAHTFGSGLGGAGLRWFVFGGVAGFGVGGVAMFQALPRLGSNLTNLIVQCGSAVVAAGLEWGWLGTRLSTSQATFAGITVLGIALGLTPGAMRASERNEQSGPPAGLASGSRSKRNIGLTWAVAAAIGQGAGAVISRKAFAVAAAAHERIDPASAAYQRAVGGLLVAAIAVAAGMMFLRMPRPRSGGAAPWVLGNALTGPILGVTCMQWALRTTPAGIVQPIVAAAPLLTIPFAWWLEGQRPKAAYYAGALAAVAGVTGLVLGK